MAHKIMQKYGFKEGQGLGKHEQGLSTALSVEKTSKRGGKIIVGDAAEKRKCHSDDPLFVLSLSVCFKPFYPPADTEGVSFCVCAAGSSQSGDADPSGSAGWPLFNFSLTHQYIACSLC